MRRESPQLSRDARSSLEIVDRSAAKCQITFDRATVNPYIYE
jgi:hypothetical protein